MAWLCSPKQLFVRLAVSFAMQYVVSPSSPGGGKVGDTHREVRKSGILKPARDASNRNLTPPLAAAGIAPEIIPSRSNTPRRGAPRTPGGVDSPRCDAGASPTSVVPTEYDNDVDLDFNDQEQFDMAADDDGVFGDEVPTPVSQAGMGDLVRAQESDLQRLTTNLKVKGGDSAMICMAEALLGQGPAGGLGTLLEQ